MSACRGCGACVYKANRFVGPKGNPQAPTVIVGESPGRDELRRGMPFTGPSGQILHNLLPTDWEEHFYITNALQCYPRKKEEDKSRMIHALKCCNTRLVSEIKMHPRKLIVALGGPALQSLTGNYEAKITQERGKLFSSELAEVGILASVHPAYLMRGGGSYRQFREDIDYANDLRSGRGPKRAVAPTYEVFDTPEKVRAIVEFLSRQKLLACDIETTGFNHRTDRILAVGITHRPDWVAIIPGDLIDHLRILFDSSIPRWIWHNGKFDIGFLRQQGFKARVDQDTLLQNYCLSLDTRVLKTDLTWVKCGLLKPGDKLIGFDERNPVTGSPSSIMNPTKVLATKRQTAKCYRINTKIGSVVCSESHMWVVRRHHQRRRVWCSTKTLAESSGHAELQLFVEPWEVDNSYEGGYVSGILDGEGFCSSGWTNKLGDSSNWVVGFSQNPGSVLDKTLRILQDKGVVVRPNYSKTKTATCMFAGYRQAMRALGIFRPVRLLEKVGEAIWSGRRKCQAVFIDSIEYVGEQEVIGIETDTRTLIAEGFLSHNCLDENKGMHNLEQVAIDLFDIETFKGTVREFVGGKKARRSKGFTDVPKPVLYDRLHKDASYTLQIHNILRPRISDVPELNTLYTKTLIPASELLYHIEHRGVVVDLGQVRDNKKWLTEDIEKAKLNICELAGYEVNPASPTQMAALIYDYFGIPPIKRHGRSTNKDVLKLLPPHPVVKGLQNFRKAHKALTSYAIVVEESVEDDGRVHPTGLIHGTKTGRFSFIRPAMQTIPRRKRLRGMFIAPPGYVLIEVDLNQAELRSLADLSGDPVLCEIYNSTDRSIHKEVAIKQYGENYTDEQYMRAKALNFGIVYGREAPSLAEEYGLSISEGQMMVDGWFKQFPVARQFILKCRKSARLGRTITTSFGRKMRFGVVSQGTLKHTLNQAANFPHQSIASDINLHTALRTHEKLRAMDAHIILLVHDSIIIECPDEPSMIDQVVRYVTSTAEQVPRDWGLTRVPFKAEAKVGTRWGSLEDYQEGVRLEWVH